MDFRLRRKRNRWAPEIALLVGGITGIVGLVHPGMGGSVTGVLGVAWSGWLLLCTVLCAFRAMAHADRLAERFGEPVGTVVLTVSAITIEVASVCAFMLGNGGDPPWPATACSRCS